MSYSESGDDEANNVNDETCKDDIHEAVRLLVFGLLDAANGNVNSGCNAYKDS